MEDNLEQDNRDQDWLQPPPREEEQRAPKRARTDDGKGRGRNARMFGVLAGTLRTAKEQATNKTDAAKKRQEIEERLAAKKKEETQAADKEMAAKKAERQLNHDVFRKDNEKTVLESVYSTRHAAAAHLAGFLCTSFEPPALPADSTLRAPVEPSRPLSLGPAFKSGARPVYYLPAKLLPAQRETIDAQIAATKAAVQADEEAWEDERRERKRELVTLKAQLDESKDGAAENGDATMQDGAVDSRDRSRSGSPEMQVDRSPTLA